MATPVDWPELDAAFPLSNALLGAAAAGWAVRPLGAPADSADLFDDDDDADDALLALVSDVGAGEAAPAGDAAPGKRVDAGGDPGWICGKAEAVAGGLLIHPPITAVGQVE